MTLTTKDVRVGVARWVMVALGVVLTGWAIVARAQPPRAEGVSVGAVSQRSVAPAGDRFALAVKLGFANDLHVWPNKPVLPKELSDLTAIPTEISLAPDVKLPKGVRVHVERAQWPAAQKVVVMYGGPAMEIESYKDATSVFVPVSVGPDAAPGEVVVALVVSYQACNDTMCFPPDEQRVEVRFAVGAPGSAPVMAGGKDFEGMDARVLADLGGEGNSGATRAQGAPGALPAAGDGYEAINVLGLTIRVPRSGPLGTVLVLLIAVAGGFVLNLTPCVLPVIPLKVLGLQKSAGTRGRLLWLGLMTSVGIVAFWLAIAALVSLGVLGGISQINSYWQFNLAVGVFMLAMGVGLLGLFTVNLPNWVYTLSADHHSSSGAVKYGILTAVLATPCVAPLAGAAIAWALKLGSAPVVYAMFAAMGVGMAIPYMLLAMFPGGVKFIPRAGEASVLLKEVMGLLVVAASLFFIGSGLNNLVADKPYLGRTLYWWFVALAVLGAGGWLAFKTFKITRSPGRRLVFGGLGVLLPALAILWASGQTETARIDWVARGGHEGSDGGDVAVRAGVNAAGQLVWNDYVSARVDEQVAQGQVVMLDFTADWCLICKTLERTVLQSDAVRDAVKASGAVAFKADVTSRSAQGWKRLEAMKQSGIPLLVIWGPGLKEPWVSNAYTVQQVADVLVQARGGKVAGR